MDKKQCQWDVVVETCFDQKTTFSVTKTTNVRDLKLHCEVEFATPAEIQVLVHEKMELDNTITIASLPSPDTETIKTFKLHVLTGLQSFVFSCMKGDMESVTKGIQDKTNHLFTTEERAFVAAFIAVGTGKRELFNSLLEDKEWFVDIISRRTKLNQRSLLHAAVAGGDLSCVVNIMVMSRGRMDLLHFEDEHESPLDLARRLEKTAFVRLLEKYEKIPCEEKTVSVEESLHDKTNCEVIFLESTSLNEFDLTSENKNAKQKDQVSGWITEASRCEIWEKRVQTPVYEEDSTRGLAKKGLDSLNSGKSNETLDRRTVMECGSSSPKDTKGSKLTQENEKGSTHKTQKEKSKASQQKPKDRFRNYSLKLRIPVRSKNRGVQENASTQRQQSMVNDDTSVEKKQALSAEKRTPKSASPSNGTVPKIKIIKNIEDLARDHHANSHANTSGARLRPTTENLITTRPFSAHSHIAGSPTATRLICARPRSSTIEKDARVSYSPPCASPPERFCIPHPPDFPSSSRRQSWSPSPDLVAKLSPVLQRKFGSACDLERPRSGSLKLIYPSSHIPSEQQTPTSTTPTSLPLVDCKQFNALRQDLLVQSMSAPTSPQSPRKLLPLKINHELEELHHRFLSTRARAQSLNYRRGSLPVDLGKDNKNKYENWRENLDTRQKHGIPFEVWLREKGEQTARKREFESAAIKAVEKLADQTWSEIRSQGKTYEQWLKEKDQMKIHNKDCKGECIDHGSHGECHKRALKYEEWLKKKDEEDLRREEVMRQEAERHFEENRRKRELENERKIARLIKQDK
ncbi:uncharacterized protein LOC116287127 [Actinia tenebrosa]|uniref:Uncharacterized protein LOC116287127 n=1 Tax=Actinia tenebrosa TaxID=6105 RepID=A0A6P8GZM4_ACTTE|nr:uncharacterized protein LOC116287127 [Actinia tenebrosa]